MSLVLLVILGVSAEAAWPKKALDVTWEVFKEMVIDLAIYTVKETFRDDVKLEQLVALNRKVSDLKNQLDSYVQNGSYPEGFDFVEQTILNLKKSLTDRIASLEDRVTVLEARMDAIEAVKKSILRHKKYTDLSVRPSFNCAKARTITERTICGNSELSNADARMSNVYSQLRQSLSKLNFRQLRNKQQAWLKHRGYCFADINCLSRTYKNRIVELESGTYLSGPSFNCAKVTTRTEKAICNHSELSNLDTRLAKMYSQLRKSLSKSDSKWLQKEQRAWLKRRNACSNNINCLLQTYEDRIVELENL